MVKPVAVITLILLLTSPLACTALRPMRLLPTPTIPTSGYQAGRVISRWTRTGIITDHMQTTLDVSALCVTWNVRAALIREILKAKVATQVELQSRIVKEAFLDEQWYEFIIAANSSVAEWADLSNDAGIWKVYLVNQRGDLREPDSIEEWQSTTAETWKYYRFINPWSKVYRVRFPKQSAHSAALVPAEGGVLTLAIRSYLGSINLQWELMAIPVAQ